MKVKQFKVLVIFTFNGFISLQFTPLLKLKKKIYILYYRYGYAITKFHQEEYVVNIGINVKFNINLEVVCTIVLYLKIIC